MDSKPKRRRWSVWKVALAALTALVLYVLSSGPYFWILARVSIGDPFGFYWYHFGIIYEPLVWLFEYDVRPYSHWLEAYWNNRAETM